MTRQAWTAAAALTALLAIGFLGFSLWHRKLEVEEARALVAAAQQVANTNFAQAASLEQALHEARSRIAELEQREAEAQQNQQTLEAEMRRALESRDVTISELQGKLTVNILDRILFDSGEATLKPEGEEVLRRIAGVLAQYPTRQVHVVGHTDNVPIRASARGRFPSNWELSTARATAAVRFLSEMAGVDPRRLGAVGYGEFHPIADNATAEGRAQNRRIALVVLSEELVGSDARLPLAVPRSGPGATNVTAAPVPDTSATTNAVPPATNAVPVLTNAVPTPASGPAPSDSPPAAPPAETTPAPAEPTAERGSAE